MEQIWTTSGIETSGSVSVELSAERARRVNARDYDSGFALRDPANEAFVPSLPVGTGILGNTRLRTPDGQITLADVKTGQIILDANDTAAQVRYVASAEASSEALRLRAPYFGLDQDVVVGTSQRVQITCDLADYMFGHDSIIIPAWALKDDIKVRHCTLRSSDRFFSLSLTGSLPLTIGRCRMTGPLAYSLPDALVLTEDEARSFALEYKSQRF